MNRRAFDAAFDEEWRRAIRARQSIAVLMIDVDYFNTFNDRHGHMEGDRVLVAVASVIAASASRPGDIAARYGGEEFVVVLPDTSDHGASNMAERIRAGVRSLALPHVGSSWGFVTFSAGVACATPVQGDRKDMLMGAADKALYVAKRRGRNCVVGGEPTDLAGVDNGCVAQAR